MSLEIPDVVLGEPDLRPTAARMTHGATRDYPVVEHRASRPPVVSVEGESRPPQARADLSSPTVPGPPRERRDVAAPGAAETAPTFRVEHGVPAEPQVKDPRPPHWRQWE